MTQYMVYQFQIERLETLAAQTQNGYMLTFYANAIRGLRNKQAELTLAQANGIIIG